LIIPIEIESVTNKILDNTQQGKGVYWYHTYGWFCSLSDLTDNYNFAPSDINLINRQLYTTILVY